MIGDNKFSISRSVNSVHPIKAERLGPLRASLLFSDISRRDCARIVSAAVRRTFARREPLFTEGQEVRSLIFLQSGNVKHTRVSAGGDETLLRISSPGDVVCVEGLSSIPCHTCSARATQKCRVLVWEHDQMQKYLAHSPRLGVNVTRILAVQLNELEERFREGKWSLFAIREASNS